MKNGQAKVEASLTESPFCPKGNPTYELAEDRKEDQRLLTEQQKEQLYHRLKKLGKSVYVYKKHIGTDHRGMVLGGSYFDRLNNNQDSERT